MLHHNENADSTSADRAQTAATSAHRIFPAGTGIRDLSIRDLPFRVFGELGLKRRHAALAQPEAMLDAGARAKTVTKSANAPLDLWSVVRHPRSSPFSNLGSFRLPLVASGSLPVAVSTSVARPPNLVRNFFLLSQFLLSPSPLPGAREKGTTKHDKRIARKAMERETRPPADAADISVGRILP